MIIIISLTKVWLLMLRNLDVNAKLATYIKFQTEASVTLTSLKWTDVRGRVATRVQRRRRLWRRRWRHLREEDRDERHGDDEQVEQVEAAAAERVFVQDEAVGCDLTSRNKNKLALACCVHQYTAVTRGSNTSYDRPTSKMWVHTS